MSFFSVGFGMGKPTLRQGVTCVRTISFDDTISEPEAEVDDGNEEAEKGLES